MIREVILFIINFHFYFLVAQAKQMIKNINYYINDYETILDSYKNDKNKQIDIFKIVKKYL